MHHATPLITTIVGGLVLAFILGMLANKLRISPLVGYLLAGVLAGPFTPGFVADTKLAPELAEFDSLVIEGVQGEVGRETADSDLVIGGFGRFVGGIAAGSDGIGGCNLPGRTDKAGRSGGGGSATSAQDKPGQHQDH